MIEYPFGHIEHFMRGAVGLYGEPACIKIQASLVKYADASRGKTLNKWQIAYLAEEISKKYYGFDLYVMGYFGDGDAVLDFNYN